MGAKLSVQEKEVPGEKTFIVTGANTGIGYITAKKIAQFGGRVIIACRSEEKAKQAIEQMQEENRQEVRAKRKAEKEEAAKQKQKEEAAAAAAAAKEKEEQERKKKEEAKAAAAAAAAEKAKEGEEKKEEGGEKKEGEEKTEEAAEKPAEEGAKEEEKPAEEGAKEEEKPAEEGTKEEEKPAEEGAKEDAKPEEGAKEEEGAKAEEEPEEEIPELKLQFMVLDLASFKSTLDFVKQYKESGLPLNCLICNAGFIAPSKVLTDDGLESSFQVNYLSHFLLTLHLIPLLKASGPNPRIINVSSSGHKMAEGVNLDNIQGQKSYTQMKFYGNSKLFQIMNMYTLSAKLKDTGIDIFTVHPGMVDTQFGRGYSGIAKALSFLQKGFGRNWNDGAATTLTAVLDEQYNGKSPLYFANCKPAQSSNLSRNEEKQNTLWRYSLELLREYLDDTILSEVGETLESIQPKEPEPEPEPEAAAGGDAESKKEGEEEKKEEGEKKEEEAGGDAGASGDAEQKEEKKEETEGDKGGEQKEE